MADGNDSAVDLATITKRFEDTRADNNRLRQELEELKSIRKQLEAEDLVPRQAYEEEYSRRVTDWATNNPDEFLAQYGLADKFSRAESARSQRVADQIDPALFDVDSEASKAFVRQYGEPALRRLWYQSDRDQILEGTGLGGELQQSQAKIKELEAMVGELQRDTKESRDYATAAFYQQRIAADPDLAATHKAHQAWSESADEYKLAAKLYLDHKAGKQAADAAAAAPTTPPPAAPPSPNEAAALQTRAEGTAVGAGREAGRAESRLRDPFAASVQYAKEELAGTAR